MEDLGKPGPRNEDLVKKWCSHEIMNFSLRGFEDMNLFQFMSQLLNRLQKMREDLNRILQPPNDD